MSEYKLPPNKKIPEYEDDVISFWKEKKIFEKSIESRPEDNLYIFYDGPPFISGLPHYGHLLGSIAKDVVPRFWTMKGKRVERVWGWDAHGLTVENKVQKKLGIKTRRDIEKYGLEKFIQECYKYTSEISAEWPWYITKIGRWVDMDNAYKTIDQDYMESVIWAFKQLYDKGYIYEGIRTSLYCTTCGTPVSNFEIAMDNTYKDVEDPSIIVKFPITDGRFAGASILAWTTTPWTIPSNRGLVVAKDEEYVLVQLDQEDESYIVGKNRLGDILGGHLHKVLDTFSGKELLGLSYEAPYKFYKSNENDWKVYEFNDMASTNEGTGSVHSAPGFGGVDTDMGYHYGLTIMMSIDDEGKFTAGNAEKNPFEGMFYKKANDEIRKDLSDRGLLFDDSKIVHRFPFHDRCDTLLIQRAQNSWFIDVQALKNRMLETNEEITWVPSHLKHGRFKKDVESSPDWCISRSRFWATPMPVWESDDGDRIVIGSVAELEELSGQKVTDLHRPYIDEITIKKDGKTYKRREEVLDSWFEAGSMPYAQIHYPFENQEKFEKNFPGDYIVEYVGQVRAWFTMLHRLSVALFDVACFKNVITTGELLGNDGRKMSKTYGNYTDPREVLETIGGDALRLYLMSSPLMVGVGADFSDRELKVKLNSVLNPYWNVAKFFGLHANLHGWKPHIVDAGRALVERPTSSDSLDLWILARLEQTVKEITENMEKYIIPNAVAPIESFIDDLSRWYLRRSRERISEGNEDALSTLYYVLLEFSKAAAPVIPFMTESVFQVLKAPFGKECSESIHLLDYPGYTEEFIQTHAGLIDKMKRTREIVSAALSLRVTAEIKVRQPLQAIYIDSETVGSDDIFEKLIEDEINVKEISFTSPWSDFESSPLVETKDIKLYLNTTITDQLRLEGNFREFVRKVQDLRKEAGLNVGAKISLQYEKTPENDEVVDTYLEELKAKVNAVTVESGEKFKLEV